MTNRDIVVIGQQDWDIEIGSNCKNIALEMSKHNRVLYVNNPTDWRTILTRWNDPKVQKRLKFLKNGNYIEEIKPNLWNLFPGTILSSVNWISNKKIFGYFNKINNQRFARCIEQAVEQLGFSNYVLFNDNLILRALHLDEMLDPALKVYYIRDNLSMIPYFQKHSMEAQDKIMGKWDVVMANSDYLADYARRVNTRSYMIGQGCDLSVFNDENGSITIPDELKKAKRPVIGYTGYLTSLRLDIDLLEQIAVRHPEWSLVLIGPEDSDFASSRLHNISNVHFLGNKSPESLPGYIKGFDVAINPQLVNEITSGNYPRKIDEYLAMGKPTVATKTSFMEYFRDYTYLSSGKDEYINLIEQALKENDEEKEKARKLFAAEHTWEKNVGRIYALIEETEKE